MKAKKAENVGLKISAETVTLRDALNAMREVMDSNCADAVKLAAIEVIRQCSTVTGTSVSDCTFKVGGAE